MTLYSHPPPAGSSPHAAAVEGAAALAAALPGLQALRGLELTTNNIGAPGAAAAALRELQGLFVATGATTEKARRRSFARFVHMLLCSNEFLYVD